MMEKEYAMQALAGLSEPWSNAACMGYCLMAMQAAGVPGADAAEGAGVPERKI